MYTRCVRAARGASACTPTSHARDKTRRWDALRILAVVFEPESVRTRRPAGWQKPLVGGARLLEGRRRVGEDCEVGGVAGAQTLDGSYLPVEVRRTKLGLIRLEAHGGLASVDWVVVAALVSEVERADTS